MDIEEKTNIGIVILSILFIISLVLLMLSRPVKGNSELYFEKSFEDSDLVITDESSASFMITIVNGHDIDKVYDCKIYTAKEGYTEELQSDIMVKSKSKKTIPYKISYSPDSEIEGIMVRCDDREISWWLS